MKLCSISPTPEITDQLNECKTILNSKCNGTSAGHFIVGGASAEMQFRPHKYGMTVNIFSV